jgi:amino acid permease
MQFGRHSLLHPPTNATFSYYARVNLSPTLSNSIKAPIKPSNSNPHTWKPFSPRLVDALSWRWLGPLPIAAFSYHSQVNLFPIYAEIKRSTLRKGTHMIFLAYAICCGLFVLVSAFGYLHFPASRTGNYLSNFGDAGGDVIHALRASFLVVTVFTFPMQVRAGRETRFFLVFVL